MPLLLHPWRFWRRRYNQSAELARRLAADLEPGGRPGRHGQGAAGAMCAPWVPDPAKVAGKRILLLGDRRCTGAGLRRADAAGVYVLALARVVKASDVLI